MFLAIKRTFKESLKSASRNIWLTLATFLVLVLSLYFISIVYVATFSVSGVMENVQDQLSVSVYFKSDTTEKEIMDAKDDFQKNGDVKLVEYVSKEQALEDFKKNNANDSDIIQSLEEIGENPLWSLLSIKAHDAEKYEGIVSYVESSAHREKITRINYAKTKEAISRLNGIVRMIERVGLTVGGILSLIAIVITFNTIRVSIYARKKEIAVMRLVGASNTYIRLPFIFEGLLHGLVSAITAMLLIFLTIRFLIPFVSKSISVENVMNFYLSHIFIIFAIQVGLGIILGVLSSLIAMRKYLKV